ncbi:MAG: tRNA (adenosine(37)-N6)-dimethylallyltransferase MiaA [Candidatus Bipolaricaulis sp.]|nr:tRNA (adenosine(37)-N6)-dimethylallyltransferase MiaA [Candidatus Bipolaricaulis sp.]
MGRSDAGTAVLVLLGPTACGKTAVSLEVARRLDGEILSADSRAFFVGLDVVTAKPSPAERRAVPHHLVDCVPLRGTYDAMAFRADVARRVPEIAARGRVPIVVGGGTLYLGAILRGVFEGPGTDAAFRRSLRDVPVEDLHRRLSDVDPIAAAKIHGNDRLRIERALEVHGATGRPISEWQAKASPLPFTFVVLGLFRERDDHRRAIAARVDTMLADGLVEEAARLRQDGLEPGDQAARTIGIPEAWAVLDGRMGREELAVTLTQATWQLARRQTAWFRRDAVARWIDVSGRSPEDVAKEIEAEWSERKRGIREPRPSTSVSS